MLPEGVLLATAEVVKAITALVTEIVKSQPPEVQKQMWEWYIEDVKAWRKFWGL